MWSLSRRSWLSDQALESKQQLCRLKILGRLRVDGYLPNKLQKKCNLDLLLSFNFRSSFIFCLFIIVHYSRRLVMDYVD